MAIKAEVNPKSRGSFFYYEESTGTSQWVAPRVETQSEHLPPSLAAVTPGWFEVGHAALIREGLEADSGSKQSNVPLAGRVAAGEWVYGLEWAHADPGPPTPIGPLEQGRLVRWREVNQARTLLQRLREMLDMLHERPIEVACDLFRRDDTHIMSCRYDSKLAGGGWRWQTSASGRVSQGCGRGCSRQMIRCKDRTGFLPGG